MTKQEIIKKLQRANPGSLIRDLQIKDMSVVEGASNTLHITYLKIQRDNTYIRHSCTINTGKA